MDNHTEVNANPPAQYVRIETYNPGSFRGISASVATLSFVYSTIYLQLTSSNLKWVKKASFR